MKEVKLNRIKDVGNRLYINYTVFETTENAPTINNLGETEITYNRIKLFSNSLLSDRVPDTTKNIIKYIKEILIIENNWKLTDFI